MWVGLTLLASVMILFFLLPFPNGLSDEACQDLYGVVLVLLVQGFPGISFVEEKIEEASMCLSQGSSPSWWNSHPRRWRKRGGRGEHRGQHAREANVRESRVLPRTVQRALGWARLDWSNQREPTIYCHRARPTQEGADLSGARPRTR